MKRCICLILLLACMIPGALSEPLIITNTGSEFVFDTPNEIEDVVSFTVGKTETVDDIGLFNLEVSDRYQYLIVPITLMNLGLEPISSKEMVQMSVQYKEKYVFSPLPLAEEDTIDPLIGTWKGRTRWPDGLDNDFYTVITKDYASGNYNVHYNLEPNKYNNYAKASKGYGEYVITYDAATHTMKRSDRNSVYWLLDNTMMLGDIMHYRISIPEAEYAYCTLDMLEENTCKYVFNLPNVVANAVGERVLNVTIGDRVYSATF